MPLTALTGSRVRERRLALGMRQADLARDAGISASYLNLIEHNRRRVAGDVLDFVFRSNSRNLRIIKKHLDKHHPAARVIEG